MSKEPVGKPSQLDAILGRAIRDDEFRLQFLDNPSVAAEVHGYELTHADRIALKSIHQIDATNFLNQFMRDPTQVMWCTDKTCYEYESNLGSRLDEISNPGLKGGG